MSEEEYLKKAKWIWKNFVPKTGQAEFEQGELLRAIEKLRDEAQRNGNANFNEKCHMILIEFLRDKLTDKAVFDDQKISQNIQYMIENVSLKTQENGSEFVFSIKYFLHV